MFPGFLGYKTGKYISNDRSHRSRWVAACQFLINAVHVQVESVAKASPGTCPVWRLIGPLRILIVAALHFLFYLDWLIEHEIRFKNPFSHRILAPLVSLRRT
jgi:hypothetical protein